MHFLLQNVPVLHNLISIKSEDIDDDERFSATAGIATMNHHEVAFCHDLSVIAPSRAICETSFPIGDARF